MNYVSKIATIMVILNKVLDQPNCELDVTDFYDQNVQLSITSNGRQLVIVTSSNYIKLIYISTNKLMNADLN